MIGLLNGTVVYREEPFFIIDVHGVGYKVLVPTGVFARVTAEGEQIKLYTHTHVREDLLELYGFVEMQDLKLFEYLISVSGVGCKTALTVFSVGSRKDIIRAITSNDVTFFTSVPRLGKKNAQKIIIELKNKLGGEEDLDLGAQDESSDEIISALKSLGFHPTEARKALKSLDGKGETVSEKVRLALKYLGK
jgi:holliday junction DNA helicase RuvA